MIDTTTKEQIREHLCNYCDVAGSDNKAAQKLGLNNAYVSQIKSRKWDALSDDMWRKIAKKLDVDVADAWNYAPTLQSEGFRGIFGACRHRAIFRGVTSLSGSGKTYMLNRTRLSEPNVFYVKCIEDITKKELYQEILLSMGKPHAKGSTLALLKLIVAEMEKKESPLLIIDEIEDCKTSVLRQLKDLYNKLEDICGTIVLGTPNLKSRIETLRRRESLAYNQVYSRFAMEFIEIPAPTAADAAKIVRAQGITGPATINAIVNASRDDMHGAIDFRSVKRLVEREQLLNHKEEAA